jgi:hypothetical protein
MRMIGWLRRVAPELADDTYSSVHGQARGRSLGAATGEGSLGALFLVCRLGTLRQTLEALDPLKDLADQETSRRTENNTNQEAWVGGAQTERYLKRYVEVFREQSFAIISMYKSIFPSALPIPGMAGSDVTSPVGTSKQTTNMPEDAITSYFEADDDKTPSALATFAPHLVDMLLETLRAYMSNISERSSRDSLLTQVLYCAGSLGRLGADFGLMLALLEDELNGENEDSEMVDEDEQEWVQVMKKHRVQASRLEILASGVGSGRKTSASLESRRPSAVPG